MRKHLISTLMLLIAACGDSSPGKETAAATAAGSLLVRCGELIDGLSNELLHSQLVSIEGGRISSVSDDTGELAKGVPVVDLRDHTCMPGLIDTHVHLASLDSDGGNMVGIYDRSIAETTRIAERNARITLQAGFTSVRNVGDYFPSVVLDMKRREMAGTVVSPRIQTAGPYMTIPAGGGDLVIPGEDESRIPAEARLGVARGAEQFAAKTQAAIDAGADFIKVIASGAVFAFGGVPGSPEMTPDEIAAVVKVAHAAGLKVTAHAHGAQSIKDAIHAGVDSIEHASLADDEAITLAAERQVAFSMDVYNGTYTADVGIAKGYPAEFMRKNEETTEAQRLVFEKAYAAGVPLIYGTDAAVYPHGLNARQFSIMVKRGMTPMAAIKSATSVAAERMTWDRDVGAIAKGRYGDLIAVRGNPLDDIAVLQTVDYVIKGGVVAFPEGVAD